MSWILYTPDALPSTCCVRKPLGINGRPSCNQTNSVKALKETRALTATSENHPWMGSVHSGLIFSSFTTGPLR